MEIRFKQISCNGFINNLNLLFKDNVITSVVGPSGSGKTSIANLLTDLKTNYDGDVLFNNLPATSIDFKRKVGMVRQEFNGRFVRDALIESVNKHNYQTHDLDKRVSDTLKLVGLNSEYLDRESDTLSGGEKIKLALACVLIYNPEIIIIDELLIGDNSLDWFIRLIRMLKVRYNKTIIVFTRDTDLAHSISDYIYIIYEGKVKAKGNKYKVFSNVDCLKKCKLLQPKVMDFAYLIEHEKNVKMEYRDDINDLIKDIYRCVR